MNLIRHLNRRWAFALALSAILLTLALLAAAPPIELALRHFERVALLEDNGETSASVSIGDLNGDGHLDIVLAKGRHWPLFNRIFKNDGKGKFIGSNLGEAPDRTYSAALADLDGDGDLDLIVSNDTPDRKLIYMNDGKGRFKLTGTFGDPKWSTRYVTLADLNGDGYPDIIAANREMPSYTCLNDRKGGFPDCRQLPTESATIIVAADFDGDGAVDLFVPHRDGGRSLILWNDGKGNFSQTTTFGMTKASIRAAAAGDLNGDGRPDLVVGDEKQAAVFVYLNLGGRKFNVAIPLSNKKVPYSIAIGDLNRDGKPDIVVGNVDTPGSVFFNDGTGRSFSEIRWNDGKGAVYGVAVGDLDGDGWPDIAASRTDAPNGVWFNTK